MSKRTRRLQWDAFATPPQGSNLASAVDALDASAAAANLADVATLRPLIDNALVRDGVPTADRPAWLESLIRHRVELARQEIAQLAQAPRPPDAPDAFAALVGMAAFLRQHRATPGEPLERLYFLTAEELGPGVGSHEVERLVRWFLARSSGLTRELHTALALTLNVIEAQSLDFERTNLSVTEGEFIAVAGVLDSYRGA